MEPLSPASTGRPPAWSYDEIVLVCDVVARNDWRELRPADQRVQDLSVMLRSSALHPGQSGNDLFRNINGVARKSSDIATAHPAYTRARTKGGATTEQVVNDFLADPDRMTAYADAMRRQLDRPVAEIPDLDLPDDAAAAHEGAVLQRVRVSRERDPKLRADKIKAVKRAGQPIACEACGFDFGTVYGAHGADYIEVHHRVPLHVTGPVLNNLSDLALLCSNCHRMIHRRQPWLRVEQVRDLVTESTSATKQAR